MEIIFGELLKLTRRIRDEFEEAPGLRLSIDEGARFWGLDENVCEETPPPADTIASPRRAVPAWKIMASSDVASPPIGSPVLGDSG